MPNPLLETKRPVAVRCAACRDHGYLMPELVFPYRYTGSLGDVYEWDGKGNGIPLGVLVSEALPCVCVAGDEFRRFQAEWRDFLAEKPARAVAAAVGRA
jgi:hypothetical protein